MKVIVVNAFSNDTGVYSTGDVVDLGQEYVDAGWVKLFEDVHFVQTTMDEVSDHVEIVEDVSVSKFQRR